MATLQIINLTALLVLSAASAVGLMNAKPDLLRGAVGFGVILAVLGIGLSLRQPGSISSVVFLESGTAYARMYVIGLSFALGALIRLVFRKITRTEAGK